MYDALMRLPLLGYALIITVIQLQGFLHYMSGVSIDCFSVLHIVLHIAMQLSTITFLLLVAAVVILRTRPSGKAIGLQPRISALTGSFLMYGIVLFPRRDLSLSLEMVSTALILIGTAGAVIALSQLGRSFSVMAESRQLVTSGPYRLVRHPLYLTEGIATIGLFMQFASVWTVLLLAAQIGFQLRRIHNEEMVLTASFPEYSAYSRNTARLIPGIY
jgi:protein-S-isoprenylcysteine O-methyltransferase Ste14